MDNPKDLSDRVYNWERKYPPPWRTSDNNENTLVDANGTLVPAYCIVETMKLLRRDNSDMNRSYHTLFFRERCGRIAERGIICPCGVDHTE